MNSAIALSERYRVYNYRKFVVTRPRAKIFVPDERKINSGPLGRKSFDFSFLRFYVLGGVNTNTFERNFPEGAGKSRVLHVPKSDRTDVGPNNMEDLLRKATLEKPLNRIRTRLPEI